MRQVLLAELIVAARCVALLPQGARPAAVQAMFSQAHIADKINKRLRRGHPARGNGTLMATTTGMARLPEPFLSDPDFADALLHLIGFQKKRLLDHKKKEK